MRYKIFNIPDAQDITTWSTGNNDKGIVIVLSQDEMTKHNELLNKMMSAVGINLEKDCLVIEVPSGGKLLISDIQSMGSLQRLFIFGFPFFDLGLQIQNRPNHVMKFETMEALQTATLEKISTDSNEKRQLWNAMKIFFAHD